MLEEHLWTCPNCGHPLKGVAAAHAGKKVSPHSRTVALILAIFVGAIGVIEGHRSVPGRQSLHSIGD